METVIDRGGIRLSAHVARARPLAAGGTRPALVLCHGFPAGPHGAGSPVESYPGLADRLAAASGWAVLTFVFRGVRPSSGNFSLGGWLDDVGAAIDFIVDEPDVEEVWLAGFDTGGSLAICAAGEDDRVRGVASFGAPADFQDWADDPARFLADVRRNRLVHDAGYPNDPEEWFRELHEIRPLALIGKIPPRPLLLVHGSDDELVSVMEARALADAADSQAELRILNGAGHALRNDPRAVAVLLGWLERQGS